VRNNPSSVPETVTITDNKNELNIDFLSFQRNLYAENETCSGIKRYPYTDNELSAEIEIISTKIKGIMQISDIKNKIILNDILVAGLIWFNVFNFLLDPMLKNLPYF
jgi:hypothetical protein